MNHTSSIDPSTIDTERLTTAWEWVLRLRQDDICQEDLVAWLTWYEADERNKSAFEEMQSFWQQADRVTEDPDPLPSELWLGDLAIREDAKQASVHGARDAAKWPSRLRMPFSRPRNWAFAGVALAAGICALILVPQTIPSSKQLRSVNLENPIVEIVSPFVRESFLPDGSRVELAAKSSVSLQFTEKERGLVMNRGVAYFTVAHNRNRPFVVKVADINVRAVGTAFNIRSAGDRVVVTVVEGTIDVYPAVAGGTTDNSGQPRTDALHVKAGSEIVWPTNGRGGPTITAVDASHALAWRQGQLDYINEPLASAIADINRYSKRPIVIRDPAVGKIIFSGTVLANEADTWVQALPALFPIDVQADASGEIILASRAKHNVHATPSR